MKKKVNVNDIFENIDKTLISERVPIHLRLFEATGKVSEYFGNVSIPLSPKSE